MRLLYFLLPLVSAEYLDPVNHHSHICISEHSYISSTSDKNLGVRHYFCKCQSGYEPTINGTKKSSSTEWSYVDVQNSDDDVRLLDGIYLSSTQGAGLVECEYCENCIADEDPIIGEENQLNPQTNLSQICQTDHASIFSEHTLAFSTMYGCTCDEGYDLSKDDTTSNIAFWTYTDNVYSEDKVEYFPDGYACTGKVVGSGTNKVLPGLAVLASVCANYILLS